MTNEELQTKINEQQKQIESLETLVKILLKTHEELLNVHQTKVGERIAQLEKQVEEIERVTNKNAHAANEIRKTVIALTALNPSMKAVMAVREIANVFDQGKR